MSRWYAHWHRVGLLVAAGCVAAAVLGRGSWSDLRVLLVLSLATLCLHQAEEYGWPGGFPRMVNTAVFRSDEPDRYPLNPRTAWIVNVALGWTLRGRTLYNPGLATSWLLFVPVLVAFVVIARRDGLLGPGELGLGVLLGLAVNYLGVVRLITMLADRGTPYRFPAH